MTDSTQAKTLRCHDPRQKTKRAINDFTNSVYEKDQNKIQKPVTKTVTLRSKSVTYVLNQECYPCPDCAKKSFSLHPLAFILSA
jgi:hypothetical protein